MIRVRKVAKLNPKITVLASGPQKITLSPPINTLGSHSENKEKKSMLRPIDKGINPKMVVMAVRITGRNLAVPPWMIAFMASELGYIFSSGSLRALFFLSINNWV